MKRLKIFILTLLTCYINLVAGNQPLIPQPAEFTVSEGEFTVPESWNVASDLPKETIEKLVKVLKQPFKVVDNPENANLILKKDKGITEEGYNLEVNPENVIISAGTEKGFFYGLQSLYQLSKLNANVSPEGKNEILCCKIEDYPRFEHRGLMLDAARYFIPKEEVLKLIDIASALKFNTLHMHLTDDNGWRLEIKKYPRLTDVGAWRVDREEVFPGRMNALSADEPTPVGGFYTQDDIKEIVDYASERYMNVIPEIEMPAHAAAAIAAYPELACPVVDKFVGVFPGIGGKDASIIMCGGNDNVYDFYCNVLDEVMDIFPSKYIHLGGDEADKSVWKECPLCNKKIEDENLKDYEELQAYFMDRINSYVRSKGRTAMGWDEVTYGDPKEDMIILGWQGSGNVAVKDAKKSGRKFILTPSKILYLLRYQGPQWFEPFTYFGNNTLKDVYLFEPVQNDWSPELKNQLMGIQGSLWTEFCNSPEDVEYLLFPRLVAVADGAWRQEGSSDWPAFVEALDRYTPELENRNITYARSMYNIQHKANPTGSGVSLELNCDRPDVDIMYSLGNDDADMEIYESPLSFIKPISLRARTYKNGEPMGKTLELNLDFNKATGCDVTSLNCNNELQNVLTNGVRGSNRQSDFEWAGWHNRNAEFVVDLGERVPLKSCKLGTMAFSHVCVAMPESVEIFGSDDNENFTLLATVNVPSELVYAKEPTKYDIDFGNLNSEARFLKFVAKNPGNVPEGYARAGAPVWIYFDEVMVD